MADYIDRKAAVAALLGDETVHIQTLLFAQKRIEALPAADVVEVRHGHWWDRGSLSCRCSCCGCKNNRETRYCPDCGANMEVDGE